LWRRQMSGGRGTIPGSRVRGADADSAPQRPRRSDGASSSMTIGCPCDPIGRALRIRGGVHEPLCHRGVRPGAAPPVGYIVSRRPGACARRLLSHTVSSLSPASRDKGRAPGATRAPDLATAKLCLRDVPGIRGERAPGLFHAAAGGAGRRGGFAADRRERICE